VNKNRALEEALIEAVPAYFRRQIALSKPVEEVSFQWC